MRGAGWAFRGTFPPPGRPQPSLRRLRKLACVRPPSPFDPLRARDQAKRHRAGASVADARPADPRAPRREDDAPLHGAAAVVAGTRAIEADAVARAPEA